MAQDQRQINVVVRVAVCGFGEIANKAHVPAIQRESSNFRLVAIVDPNITRESAIEKLLSAFSLTEDNVSIYQSLSDCLESSGNSIDAVSVCTPSSVTLDLALIALKAGKHVLVEKPPGDWRRLGGLQALAESQQLAFFTAYHTTACVGCPMAQEWLRAHLFQMERVHVTWKENVRKWHPGQTWVTKKSFNDSHGCDGVSDMVFNPLSMLHALLGPLTFQSSTLVVPSNWETPIAGSFALSFQPSNKDFDVPVTGDFSWDYEPLNAEDSAEVWTIEFQSEASTMSLSDGGSQVEVDGRRVTRQPTSPYPLKPEYENLYQGFSSLIAAKRCSIDDATPKLLEEIHDKARLSTCPPFEI